MAVTCLTKVLIGGIALTWGITPSRAAAQHVYLATGRIEEPANLKAGGFLDPTTRLRMGDGALVILTYSWPSDRESLFCNRWMIYSGKQDFEVPYYHATGTCKFEATGEELTAGLRASQPVQEITFYGPSGDAKEDQFGTFATPAEQEKITAVVRAASEIKDRERKARERAMQTVGPALLSGTPRQLGPVGGTGGQLFVDSCDDVAEVHVREGYFIDAIQLVCRGSAARPVRGGTGGTERIFPLQPGEHITAVSGSAMGPDNPFVFSVQLYTDQRSSPVYGNHGPTPGQIPFRFEIPAGSRFGGFWGQASRFLDALGVVIYGPQGQSPPMEWRLGPVGGTGGQFFVDSCDDVAEVHVREGWFIDAIQLVCRGSAASPVRGGTGGTENIFQLQPGEHITAVSGSAMGPDNPFVFSVQLHTDQRSSPVYGNHGPTPGQIPFRFEIPAGSRFGGFWGQASRFLDALGVVIRGAP